MISSICLLGFCSSNVSRQNQTGLSFFKNKHQLSIYRSHIIKKRFGVVRESRGFVMEITSKDERGGAPVLDIDYKSTVGGGVEDVYSEHHGYSLLRDAHYNKGLAFTEKERDAHYLLGEENDAQYLPISSSTSEVHGHDGPSAGEE